MKSPIIQSPYISENLAFEPQNEHLSKFNPSFLESMAISTLLNFRVISSSDGWKSFKDHQGSSG